MAIRIALVAALLVLAAGEGAWNTLVSGTTPTARHEGCAVLVNGAVYMIGGRNTRPVNRLDIATNVWTQRAGYEPGGTYMQLHHMQCVAIGNIIYMPGAWTGGFPFESNVPNLIAYDTENDVWLEKKGLSAARNRGSGAVAVHNGKIYLAMGNRGGHGGHATTLGWFDVYDPATDSWSALPNAPDARDHVTGGIVQGKFCIAGGRDGGHADFWENPVTRINCWDFASSMWEQKAHMPHGRAGTAAGGTCDGLLMIAGGEGIPIQQPGRAFDRVDLYDVTTDSFRKPIFLNRARHGSGLGISDCSCGNIYLPSGSGNIAGSPELTTTEVWAKDGALKSCP